MMSIGRVVATLATSEKRPDAAGRAALANPDAVVERTIDIMERAAAEAGEDTIAEHECIALGILVVVRAQLRDPRVHRPLPRLRACDEEKVDQLFGGMTTGAIPGILIATFDGSPQALTNLMEDRDAHDFCRDSGFRAWTYLAAMRAWPKIETRRWLHAAFDTLQPERDSHVSDPGSVRTPWAAP